MDDYKKKIGARLKTARKNQHLTQEQIAEMLNISQKHYSEAERGLVGLSIRHYVELSSILDVSLDYLLKNDYTRPYTNQEQANHLFNSVYNSASPYTQKQIISIMQIIYDIECHIDGQDSQQPHCNQQDTKPKS